MTESNFMSEGQIEQALRDGRVSEVRDQFLIKKGMNIATRELLGELKGRVDVASYDQLEATLATSEKSVESSLALLDLMQAILPPQRGDFGF